MIAKAAPPPSRKDRIEAAFGAASASYDHAAIAQRQVARRIAAKVLASPPPPGAKILEIGCGTGLLTRELWPPLRDRRWLITDLAEPMLARCKALIGDGPSYRLMDGELPDVEPASQDLIVASLAFQWFEDLGAGLERLASCLRPGGRLLFSVIGDETFHEWRSWLAERRGPQQAAMGDAPDAATLGRWATVVAEERIPLDFGGCAPFLRHLKELGAGEAAPGYRQLSPRLMREALRSFDGRVTYHVLYAAITRS